MTVQKGQIINLDISHTAFGGKGVAKVDGFTVFVENAVTGDRVAAKITRKKKTYAEARATELITPSPHRVPPPCPYSGYCGGCKWQFVDYPHQLVCKRLHVDEALRHIGLIREVPVHPAIASPDRFQYRNKMEFSCSDRKWLLPEELGREDVDRGFALGLHVPGTFDKVLDISACLLQPDLGNAMVKDVRDFMKRSGVPPYGLKSHQGFWRFLMLRHSAGNDQWMVNLITSSDDRKTVQPLADFLQEKYPSVVSVVNNITSRKAAIAIGETERLLSGRSCIQDTIGPYTFEISANSFFQTNTHGAFQLYEKVREYAALTGDETVLDLYCGTGTIGIYLSKFARKIIGVEIAESAVSDARNNSERNGVSNCVFIAGDIRTHLSAVDAAPRVIIIDPPRTGMHPDVVRQVLAFAPERIVYVSCNPATLARDLAMLKDAYTVAEVQPVDLFPHTFHIESVARLVRRTP